LTSRETREIEFKVKVEIPETFLELMRSQQPPADKTPGAHMYEMPSPEVVFEEPPPKPIILGHKILLERRPGYEPVAEKIQSFSRLEEANEDVLVYLVNKLSLWKAAETGATPDEVVEFLKLHARTTPKSSLRNWIARIMSTYGAINIVAQDHFNILEAVDEETMNRLLNYRDVKSHLYRELSPTRWRITQGHRGELKQVLLDRGYPVKDQGIFEDFKPLRIEYEPGARESRDYQEEALRRFTGIGGGTVILPPGTGKTVIAVMATVDLKAPTLVLCTRAQICEQFRREYLGKTTARADEIAVIHGGSRIRRPRAITITTYQMASGSSRLAKAIWGRRWGLIVYDECQHIPSDLWRKTAQIQAVRRLGLTATPVREDAQEKRIFSLIGPPIMDRGWLEMAEEGFIAEVEAYEVLVGLSKTLRQRYERGSDWDRVLITANNPAKIENVRQLLEKHDADQVLIIGFYVEGAKALGEKLDVPVITGEVTPRRRDELYGAFRRGELKRLVMTSVGEEGIDLPNANVGINICGLYGSRMGFSQRFGRVLRPKEGQAFFYELVTAGTVEQDYSERRRAYLISRGYDFETIDMTGE